MAPTWSDSEDDGMDADRWDAASEAENERRDRLMERYPPGRDCEECGEPVEGGNPLCVDCRDEGDVYDDPDVEDLSEFADPGGRSALRAETPTNPRNLPCPTCRQPNQLTPKDKALGYQCDSCADRAERGMDY